MTNRELVQNYYPNSWSCSKDNIHWIYLRQFELGYTIGYEDHYVENLGATSRYRISHLSMSESKAWESVRDIIIKRLHSGESKEYIRDNPQIYDFPENEFGN